MMYCRAQRGDREWGKKMKRVGRGGQNTRAKQAVEVSKDWEGR